MTSQTLNLKPCPFCGSVDVERTYDDGLSWIKCKACGSTGPATTRYSGEEGEPFHDWSTRSPSEISVINYDALKFVCAVAKGDNADVREIIEAYLGALPKRESGWLPISNPPKHEPEKKHSIRVLGWNKEQGTMFAQYTPWYLGHEEEHKKLWIFENYSWAFKPTVWRHIPSPEIEDEK